MAETSRLIRARRRGSAIGWLLVATAALSGCSTGPPPTVSVEQETPATTQQLTAAAYSAAEAMTGVLATAPPVTPSVSSDVDEADRIAGSRSGAGDRGVDEPTVAVTRLLDYDAAGLDVSGSNSLTFTASIPQGGGRSADLRITFAFPQDSPLVQPDAPLTLDSVVTAVRTKELMLAFIQVTTADGSPSPLLRVINVDYFTGQPMRTQPGAEAAVPLTVTETNELAAFCTRFANRLRNAWGDAPAKTSTEALMKAGLCAQGCVPTGSVAFTHPTWGEAQLITTLPSRPNDRRAGIYVIDSRGEARWRYETDAWSELSPAATAPDRLGHIFVRFNPGRLDGIVVLAPSPAGFESFGSLPPPGEYRTRFYGAAISDNDSDGIQEVVTEKNDCDPTCAEGKTTRHTFTWSGSDYTQK